MFRAQSDNSFQSATLTGGFTCYACIPPNWTRSSCGGRDGGDAQTTRIVLVHGVDLPPAPPSLSALDRAARCGDNGAVTAAAKWLLRRASHASRCVISHVIFLSIGASLDGTCFQPARSLLKTDRRLVMIQGSQASLSTIVTSVHNGRAQGKASGSTSKWRIDPNSRCFSSEDSPVIRASKSLSG